MKSVLRIVFASALLACFCASGEGKALLVLQVGSDWCDSGEDVRRVFESASFRRAIGSGFEFAVYDDMDNPTPTVKAANEKLARSRVETRRFPAITCLTGEPRRFYAQLENIPFDVTSDGLAAQVSEATKAKNEAETLFRQGASMRGEASADCYGRAFEILAAHVGEFNEKRLREGDLAYEAEWRALAALDEGGRYGWTYRFEMGYGVDIIEKATKFRTDDDFRGGSEYIASLRKIPTKHLTVEQRQCIDIAEYALWRKKDDRLEENVEILKRALALGRDTVWGQCALGYIVLSGEEIPPRARYRAPVIPRPEPEGPSAPEMKLSAVERRIGRIAADAELTEKERRDIALYAALMRIGKDAWDELRARPGSRKFMSAFFRDRGWMEDFAWSGPCDGAKSILALESLVFQDDGRWIRGGDCTGRRFATAVALEQPERDEVWLADYMDAFRATALAKRLHRHAVSQPVWQWRFAIQQSHREAHSDDPANQQRHIDKYFNVPLARYQEAHWNIPYRTYNCFGESVQTPAYYEPWIAAGEWVKRRYSPIIGGVCGELSKFGSACANAHGLSSSTAGQPAHCAYTRRRPDGRWEICNNVESPTRVHLSLFPGRNLWTYLQAHEGTFEGDREKRLDAARFSELARFAEKRGASAAEIAEFHKRACGAWPGHYTARQSYGEWIARAKRPLAEHRAFAMDCAKSLAGWRQPLWDLLSPYFARVAVESGPRALKDALVEFAPLLRQGEDIIAEEGDFSAAMKQWVKPLEGDKALMEAAIMAVVAAQRGTRDFFAQTLAWCGDFMLADAARLKRFVAALGKSGSAQNTDLAPMILAAAKNGNLHAFRQLADLQDKLSPSAVKTPGKQYPMRDFGAPLLSADGMLTVSTTSRWDTPQLHVHAIDATPRDGNALHTSKEKCPWAMVTLPGPAVVKGVIVENRCTSVGNRARQVPLEVQLSETGDEWHTVFTDGEARETYRIDLRKNDLRSRYIRVRRTPDAKDEVFHLSKILVYGTRLY